MGSESSDLPGQVFTDSLTTYGKKNLMITCTFLRVKDYGCLHIIEAHRDEIIDYQAMVEFME